MKAKTYRLKPDITREYLVQNLKARDGGSWIHPSSDVFISKEFTIDDAEISVSIAFFRDISDWDDFHNVLVLDEDWGQPYIPFYGNNYKADITNFPFLEKVIAKYNEYMASLGIFTEVQEDE